MKPFKVLFKPLLASLLIGTFVHGHAQTIKIGEVNSYKAHANFLGPYKKGMELAIEEINAGVACSVRKSRLFRVMTMLIRATPCVLPRSYCHVKRSMY